MNLTKDSCFLLHAIHNFLYRWILQKILLCYGFKTPCKSIREIKKFNSIHEWHFVEQKNEERKPDKDSSLRRLKFMPRKLEKNCRSRIPSQDKLVQANLDIIGACPAPETNSEKCIYTCAIRT